MTRSDISRSDLAFLAFSGVYTAVSLLLLILGLGPPLAKALPGLAESFEAWGRGEGPISALWRGMA